MNVISVDYDYEPARPTDKCEKGFEVGGKGVTSPLPG